MMQSDRREAWMSHIVFTEEVIACLSSSRPAVSPSVASFSLSFA